MNILICVKQVPDTTEVKINQETGTLIRAGVPSILNPYDAYAMEAAVRIKERNPDTKIVVISMGPESAAEVLRECLAMSADKAYLVSDPKFGGSDTLATAYILYKAMKEIEKKEGMFDLVFCGNQAIDGETAQVGPELAEYLNYPQVTGVLDIKHIEGNELEVLHAGEMQDNLISTSMPCVCTFAKSEQEVRPATIRNLLAAQNVEIPTLRFDDFTDMDLSRIGLHGSHTKVIKTFIPEKRKNGLLLQNGSTQEKVGKMMQLLDVQQLI